MKETLSRAKYADRKRKPVSLTQVFHLTDSLHYDMVLLPLMNDILPGGAAFVAQEAEQARVASMGNDHESSDEDGDPEGFIADIALRKFAKDFKTVPRGGHGEKHQHQLAKSRQRVQNFATTAWGQIPSSSAFNTYMDTEDYVRPFLDADPARPLAGAVNDEGEAGGSNEDAEGNDDYGDGNDDDGSEEEAGGSDTDRDPASLGDVMDSASDFSADN